MKTFHIIISALLATTIVSCDGNEILPETPDAPETPEQPTESYRFTFGGSIDTDEEATRASWTDESTDKKLVFGWDYTNTNDPTYEMKMAFISPQGSPLVSTGQNRENGKNYTDVTIMKHSTKSDDRHWAEFETVERYDGRLKEYDGYKLIAVNGKNSELKQINDKYAIQLTMPNTFEQSAANSLTHLSDYMYMYDTYMLKEGDAHLEFNHLTAPVRFRIHNWRPSKVKIYSVTMHANQSLAGSSVSVASDGVTYSSTHSSITVKAANNSYFTIAERSQKEYIDLYAHVMPLAGTGIQAGDSIKFTIEANDVVIGDKKVQYLTSKLDHISVEKFETTTGSSNWRTGYLYTFHLYLDDAINGVTISSISIKDWVTSDEIL